MSRKIRQSAIVITGASSGIGRAAALAFARQGASLVLAARRGEALETLARECEQAGGHAVAVPTDVTSEDSVEALARTAGDRFGRIDIWVNNAAVTLFTRLDEAPIADYRQVIETNFFGYLHGARAALRYFREQGKGVLINVDSVVAYAPQPYTSAYVASKYAIRGLSDCLRMELALDHAPEIRVCTVLPASVDTPLFHNAANYTGRAIKALDPVNDPEQVAAAILAVARRPRREVLVGKGGMSMTMFHAMVPSLYEKVAAHRIDHNHFENRPADPTAGNLYEPNPDYATLRGGWRGEAKGTSTAALAAAGIAAVAIPALLVWAWNGRRRKHRPLEWLRRLRLPA